MIMSMNGNFYFKYVERIIVFLRTPPSFYRRTLFIDNMRVSDQSKVVSDDTPWYSDINPMVLR